MQFSLAFQLELLLDNCQQISIMHESIYRYLSSRRCQKTLLKYAELVELQLSLGLQEEGEVIAEGEGVKPASLGLRFGHCLYYLFQGIVPSHIISKTFLLQDLIILSLYFLMQQDIIPDDFFC